MNIDSVRSLFRLFTGEESEEKYLPLILSAVSEVESMLLPEADNADVRLDYLCAALANHRFQLIKASSGDPEYTFAGKLPDMGKNTAVAYSGKLLAEYYELCRELVGGSFFFSTAQE